MADNSSKAWDFQEQIKVGNRGQDLFINYYHSPLVVFPEHKADFRRVKDNKLLELKTDTYNMNDTPYFFMERWSDISSKKPGGPWQSLSKRVQVFCYLFVNNSIYFEFNDLKKLTKELDKITEKSSMIWIRNRGWTSGGYKVRRTDLSHLYEEYEFHVEP